MIKKAIENVIENAIEKMLKKIILFDVNTSNDSDNKNNALILSGCKLSILENITYSELDENNYIYINDNDYGCECINIELNFDNNYKNPYFEFFLNCITIRVDNKILFKDLDTNYTHYKLYTKRKVNKVLAKKKVDRRYKSYTKINKNGKLSIGVGYFFKSKEEYKIIKECNSFIIEGFIALNKKNNIYGFMCEVKKEEDLWFLSEGNTYKIFKNSKIDELSH